MEGSLRPTKKERNAFLEATSPNSTTEDTGFFVQRSLLPCPPRPALDGGFDLSLVEGHGGDLGSREAVDVARGAADAAAAVEHVGSGGHAQLPCEVVFVPTHGGGGQEPEAKGERRRTNRQEGKKDVTTGRGANSFYRDGGPDAGAGFGAGAGATLTGAARRHSRWRSHRRMDSRNDSCAWRVAKWNEEPQPHS